MERTSVGADALGGPTLPGAEVVERPASLEPGSSIGRHVVVRRLGAGGMGVVLEARDPELGRHVAVKVLHDSMATPKAVARLRAEARALARLNHPNVVAIHDVGEDRGRVYIAMELVHGRTLDAWIRDLSPSVSEIVARMRDAGLGLAAAHAAGLVHGDLKPSNIMITDAGRVHVLDFGLASDVSAPASRTEADTGATVSVGERGTPLLGTPAYMSLETFRGADPAPAADQFAFCVTLFEALYGARPFVGNDTVQLIESLQAVAHPTIPARPPLPSRLRAALRRGLARTPEDRFPTMTALLDELHTTRRGASWYGSRVAALGLVGLGVLAFVPTEDRRGACRPADERLRDVWSPELAAAGRDAFTRAQPSWGASAWSSAQTGLDAYAEAWSSAQTAVCAEAVDAPGRDLTLACLERARSSLQATVVVLLEADGARVERAGRMVLALPNVEACLDRSRDAHEPPPPVDPNVQRAVAQLDAEIAEIQSLLLVGAGRDLADRIDAMVERAEATGYAPVVARVRLQRALFHKSAGESARAAGELDEVFFGAREIGATQLAFTAAAAMTELLAPTDPDEADRWARHAEGQLVAADPEQRSELAVLDALVARARGENEAALAFAQRAIERAPQGWETIRALQIAGEARLRMQRYDEALADFDRARELMIRSHGELHPHVGAAFSNRASVLMMSGREDEALVSLRRAVAILEATTGERDAKLGRTYGNLAMVLRGTGDLEQSLAYARKAADVLGAALGEDHPERAKALIELGSALVDAGRSAEGCSRIADGERIFHGRDDLDRAWLERAVEKCR